MLCKYGKRKLQSADYQLTAILRSCLGRIRTLTGGTRIRRATITPQDILKTAAKVLLFSDSAKFSAVFFTKTAIFFSHGGFSEHFRA